jgi:hypothetical protein
MRFQKILALVPLTIAMVGCGEFNTPITKKFSMSVKQDEGTCKTESKAVDLKDDETFKKYKDKITGITVTDLKMTITNGKSDPKSVATKVTGTMKIGATEATADTTLTTYDVPLETGTSKDLTVEANAATKAGEIVLEDPNTLYISTEGCADAVPAYFDADVEITFEVKAKVL